MSEFVPRCKCGHRTIDHDGSGCLLVSECQCARPMGRTPGIRDVPCEPCQHGYGSPHACESPYCVCEQSGAHVPPSTEDAS